VHEYLTSLHTEIRATRTDVSELADKVESCSDSKIRQSVKEVVLQCLGSAMAPYSALANSLNMMATSLRSGLHVPTVSPGTEANPPLVPIQPPLNQASPMEVDEMGPSSPSPPSGAAPIRLCDVVGHHPKPHYVSIHQLYEEFYGLGGFEGKPVPGGLSKLEELFKTRWRRGFANGQKKEWSRLTMTIRGINAHIAELDGNVEVALDNLDLVFREKTGVNHTLSKMIMHMQESGLLVKGVARGRYVPANVSAS
jgi:hypothetical protein